MNLNGEDVELPVDSVEVVVAAGCPMLNWKEELVDGWELAAEVEEPGVDENSDEPCRLLLFRLNRFEALLFLLRAD